MYFFNEVKDKPSIDLRGNRMRPYENYCWVSPAQEPALFSFLPSALREETDAEYTRTSSPTRCGSGSAGSRRPLPREGLWSRGLRAGTPSESSPASRPASIPALRGRGEGKGDTRGSRPLSGVCRFGLQGAGARPADSETD